jgi:hypothetical protein
MADTQSDWDKGATSRMFADPDALFITHTQNREVFSGVRKRFDQSAGAAGCHEDPVETVHDSNGRPVFEILKLACNPVRPPTP